MNKRLGVLLSLLLALSACTGEDEGQARQVRAVNITTATSTSRDIQVVEEVIGRILDPAMVTVSAEVSARVLQVLAEEGDAVHQGQLLAALDPGDFRASLTAAEAEYARLGAQADAQRRLVQRYRKLATDKFVSPTILDQAEADLKALEKAMRAAAAQRLQSERNLARTRIKATMVGRVQQRLVAAGDYIKAGAPLFTLVAGNMLRVTLPIPETKSSLIQVGQRVRLHLPGDPRIVESVIREIKPMVIAGSAAVEARIDLAQPGGWLPGASVVAEIVVAERRQAVVVPEASVVLRPVGEVVYVIADGKAAARGVHTGIHIDGLVEIVSDLKPGETIAVDGAAFLSDGAAVQVQEPAA